MDDDTHVIDNGWDALPEYTDKFGEADDAVTVSISTTPGEWLVNTVDSVVVPMSMAEVVDAMRAHKLTERSLVWRQGMQEWSCIDAVPQLKLAARMAPAPARRPPEKPSSPPARQAPPPPKTPVPNAGLSRRSTLPFGFTSPPGSRPAHTKPTLPPASTVSAASTDEPEVLAVYARPAATISFDLSPEQPLRAPPPKIIPQQPLTLAPTTSDSSPRSAPPPPNRYADLSVVAAADFRAVKRSSKRSVMVWSVLSAAAASLFTFWLVRSEGGGAPRAAARPPEAGVALSVAAAAPVAAPVDVPAPPIPSLDAPETVASAAASVAAPLKPIAKAPKPVARRPKPPQTLRVEPITADSPTTGSSPPIGNTKSPSNEPNPYDVKLDDEAPSVKAPAVQGSGLDDAANAEASASGSKTPGF